MDRTAHQENIYQRMILNNKRRNAEIKREVFMHYSNGIVKCYCCGEDNYKFLSLDHSYNNGNSQRKKSGQKSGSPFYRWLKKMGFPKGYKISCYNCNLGRGFNNNICPHKETKIVVKTLYI